MRNLNKKRSFFGVKTRYNSKPIRRKTTNSYNNIDRKHAFTRAEKVKKSIQPIFEIGDVVNLTSPVQLTPISVNIKNELTTELTLFHSKTILKNEDYNKVGLIIDVFYNKKEEEIDYLILINEQLFITNLGFSKIKLIK